MQQPNAHLPDPQRRGFLKKALAAVVGGIVMVIPAAAGLLVWLDPLKRRSGGAAEFIPVTNLDAVPADGTPAKFQIVTDLVDAWTRTPNVPVGAVFLKRNPDNSVVAFSVICPHAGCSVDVGPDGKSFRCPCHNSSFHPDGSIVVGKSVSPRGLDKLEIDPKALEAGAVHVRFQKFRSAVGQKIPL